MKKSAFLLFFVAASAVSQTLPKFAAKCDSSLTGRYMIIVSEGRAINMLEKPTRADFYPWRGLNADIQGDYYKFFVASLPDPPLPATRKVCSLHRKSGELQCGEGTSVTPLFVCSGVDYESTLSDYRRIQSARDSEIELREAERKKREAERPYKF